MKSRFSLLLLSLLVFPLVFSCGGGDDDSGSSEIGKIAFTSYRDGNFEILVMDADGENQRNISNSSSWDERYPAWSPDGTQIAFVSRSLRDGDIQIYVMDAD